MRRFELLLLLVILIYKQWRKFFPVHSCSVPVFLFLLFFPLFFSPPSFSHWLIKSSALQNFINAGTYKGFVLANAKDVFFLRRIYFCSSADLDKLASFTFGTKNYLNFTSYLNYYMVTIPLLIFQIYPIIYRFLRCISFISCYSIFHTPTVQILLLFDCIHWWHAYKVRRMQSLYAQMARRNELLPSATECVAQ